jgi:DNA-binding winged helix-turn-helix (wHTH) protein
MHTYAFGAFELDPARRSLTRTSGQPVALGGKAFDALVCLIEHAGEVVTRDTLSSVLWPTTEVEDNNLSQTIQALRRALGDTGPRHLYIATVPRRGYQFVANVTARQSVSQRYRDSDTAKAGALPTPAKPPLRQHGVRSVVLIAGATSIALNLLFLALLMFSNSHRDDPSQPAAASARSPAPVKPAKWIAERDKRELSIT